MPASQSGETVFIGERIRFRIILNLGLGLKRVSNGDDDRDDDEVPVVPSVVRVT